jgi:DNA-binding NtrC family response regulator
MNLKQANILVIDDDRDVLTAVRFLLKSEVKNIVTDTNPDNIKRLMTENTFDILMLDMNFTSSINTGNEGLFWLREIKQRNPKVDIIMITAYANIDLAVSCLKEGASDFLVKPWHNDLLIKMLKEVLEKHSHTSKLKRCGESERFEMITGESEAMQNLFRKLEKIAPTDANVLILGENGTGKDLLAQAIYRSSLRSNKAFIKVDVGALTETLFESELFGHKKGAFTDAREDRMGMIEAANGGTLFLDEIGNISLQQQARLLTVLQNRQVMRIGTNVPIPVDIRLISATNVPFGELANENRFRKDLIYRINTVEMLVPPLRERGNDVILLAERFLQMYAKKYAKPTMKLSQPAIEKLLQYSYPGNVRELQYAVERAVIMSESDELDALGIVFSPLEHKPVQYMDVSQSHNLEDLERATIMAAIDKHNGNISKAAKELGLTRAALYRRMEKYGM